MDGFSARDAVVAGVSLARRRPGVMLVWVLLDLAVAILNAAGIQLQKSLVAATLAMDVLALGISVVVWTSAYRALLRPDDRRRAALGRAEWCVLWARVIPQVVLVLPLLFLVPIRLRFPQWAPALDTLFVTFTIVIAFWSAVAGVWAFDRLEIALVRCWRLARGRFWKLAAVFVACALVVRGVRWGVSSAALLMNHQVPLGRITLDKMGSPPVLFVTAASAVVSALEVALLAGVVVTAYQAYCARSAASALPADAGDLAGA